MSITINRVHDANDVTKANLVAVKWAVWPTKDITVAPAESGSDASSDASGEMVIPCTASAGLFMLYLSNIELGLYDTDTI